MHGFTKPLWLKSSGFLGNPTIAKPKHRYYGPPPVPLQNDPPGYAPASLQSAILCPFHSKSFRFETLTSFAQKLTVYGLILMNVTPSPRLSEFQIGSSETLHLPSIHVLSCPKGSPRGQGNPTLPATSMAPISAWGNLLFLLYTTLYTYKYYY